MEYITHSEKETTALGERLGKKLAAGDGVLFCGEMGSGKTYFTKGIGRSLGITDEITSPTFAVVNEYFGKMPLFHFDLYRIADEDDLYSIGFYDYLQRGGVIVVEWSENVLSISDEFRRVIRIDIEKLGDSKRKITIEGAEPCEL